MTVDELRRLFTDYQRWVHELTGILPCESPTEPSHLGHVAHMCHTAVEDLLPQGKIEKAMRWLGFIQGVLVTRGFFTLEQVKNHSRPDEEHSPLSDISVQLSRMMDQEINAE